MFGSFRVIEGATLRLFHIESVANIIYATVDILYDDGFDERVEIPAFNGTADRTSRIVSAGKTFRKNGWVTHASVMIGPTTKRGQAYAILSTSPATVSGTMILSNNIAKGYIYDGHLLSLGEFVEPGPGGGEGFLRIVAIDVVASTDMGTVGTVPTNTLWRVLGINNLTLTTSADAGNRRVRLRLVDVDGGAATSVAGGVHPASVVGRYTFARGVQANYTNNTTIVTDSDIVVPIPDILLKAAGTVIITTDNFDTVAVADEWTEAPTDASLYAEEWLVI